MSFSRAEALVPILQMEAMFRTVISLKVAAIPHRHLYKVKTGLSMVERSRGGRAAAGRRRPAIADPEPRTSRGQPCRADPA